MQLDPIHYGCSWRCKFLAGRDFTDADERRSSPVAIVNETMARYYFRDGSALGKRFAWWHTDPKNIEIIGVVKDAKYDNLRQQPMRMVYQSSLQHAAAPGLLQVRLSSDRARPLAAVIQDCRAVIGAVDARVDIRAVEPLSVAVDQTLHPERLAAQLSAGFGVIGLLLMAIGLYGILAYSVVRRTAEFGLRMALGAKRATILRMVVRDGLRTITAGLVLGLCAPVPLTGLLAHLLYGVEPRDMTTIAGAVLTLTLVALIAAYLPARRATNVDPSVALRVE